jgi:hypothetical protein
MKGCAHVVRTGIARLVMVTLFAAEAWLLMLAVMVPMVAVTGTAWSLVPNTVAIPVVLMPTRAVLPGSFRVRYRRGTGFVTN